MQVIRLQEQAGTGCEGRERTREGEADHVGFSFDGSAKGRTETPLLRRELQGICDTMARLMRPCEFSFSGIYRSYTYLLIKPIQALENPRFRELIELVARSKDGEVNFPTRQATRKAIIQKYRAHLLDLRKRLNVCLSQSYFVSCGLN